MALHFVDDAAADTAPGGVIALTGSEAHHAVNVRRVRVGESVTLTDGRGAWVSGTIALAGPKRMEVHVDAREERPGPARRVLLAQALAKGDRDELAVQAATELGVDGIIPWQASRSVSRWQGPKADKGRARWQMIVREASKQALRAWIPEVMPAATTAEIAARAGATVVVLDPWTDDPLTTIDLPAGDLILVVGPEGGIAPDEIEKLTGAGAVRARLGDSVLRTSTAGPAALAVLNARLGRW